MNWRSYFSFFPNLLIVPLRQYSGQFINILPIHWNDIIEGCKQQNRQSQEQLYKACYTTMIKLCARYARDIDEAGALYNESMMKVFNNLHQYKGECEVPGWIRRIVVNTCIDHCRKLVKFTHQPMDDINGNIIMVDPEVYSRLGGHDVIRMLQELPRNTSLVFSLFVLEGYKHDEIAKLLGISAGTSKWHLNEARRLLKNKMDSVQKKEIYSNAI